MEFLMTYGWAILVVLIAIGALAYFGVLNPGRFLPNSCTVGPGIGCDDFRVTQTDVQLILRNGLGDDLGTVWVSVIGCDLNESADGGIGGIADTWVDGEVLGPLGNIKLQNCNNGAAGTKFKEDINLGYVGSSGIQHNKTGLITARVEE